MNEKMPIPIQIRRNALCPCKSGKKFKHCHGALRREMLSKVPEDEARDVLRKMEAAELLRKRQQGHGRPMISFVSNGTRFVAVGSRIAYSKNWRYFPDFLLDNMKRVMDREWGRAASESSSDHPLFEWLRALQAALREVGMDKPVPYRGGISALNRFCYSLYLIEHNDKLPKSLIKRLKKPSDFPPACYEALVASAFALAGASINGAEDVRGNHRRPEFFASFGKGGKRYSVEAKRKRGWKASFDLRSEQFTSELRSWLRDQLHKASSKELENPVYWFELSIGERLRAEDATTLQALVGDAISEAESITVKGHPANSEGSRPPIPR